MVFVLFGMIVGAAAAPAMAWSADDARHEASTDDDSSALLAHPPSRDAALPMSALLALAGAARTMGPGVTRVVSHAPLVTRLCPATIAAAPRDPTPERRARLRDIRVGKRLMHASPRGARSDDIPLSF